MIGEKWKAFKEDIQGQNFWYVIRKVFLHYVFFFKNYDKKKAKSFRMKVYQKIAFSILTKIPGWKGTTDKQYDRELIVSLTSYPERINSVPYATKSLLLQDRKPNRLILWLAESQFPNKEADLPKELVRQCRYGLEIRWCEDLRSYKKLIPALQAFPEAVIVTVDDDVHYRRSMLRMLHDAHLKQPDCIWAHNISLFVARDGKMIGRVWDAVPTLLIKWNRSEERVSSIHPIARKQLFVNQAVGCYGILYPPHSLYSDVLDQERFTRLCETNDDIWFWSMAVLAGTRTATLKGNYSVASYVEGTQESFNSLYRRNEYGGLFERDYFKMIEEYPSLQDILLKEFEKEVGTIEGVPLP